MAERRMFAKSVVQQDLFCDMPLSTQALYFHLGMEADDDGFVDRALRITRSIGASNDDMRILRAKGFVIDVGDGVIVVRDWKVSNFIRTDRYKPTQYASKKGLLTIDERGRYGFPIAIGETTGIIRGIPTDNQTETNGVPSGSLVVSIGKDRLGEDTNILSNQLDESDSFEAPKKPKRSKKPTEAPAEFTRFYTAYPRREGKEKALQTWLKLNPNAELAETIISHVERRKETDWCGKDRQYIPLPATFLNQQRWTDELMPATRRMEAADRELN